MESVDAIAIFMSQQDDQHSDEKIIAIQELMMRARLTQASSLRMNSEIKFYESRKELNRMLMATENKALIRANAIKILHRMISETEIPSRGNRQDTDAYQKRIDDYVKYLQILSKN